jgi:hypothetical protein
MSQPLPAPEIGHEFGRWTVVGETYTGKHFKRHVPCRCACGTERDVDLMSLLKGHTTSCRCKANELTTQRNFKHGLSHAPGAKTWYNMIHKCHDPNNPNYKNYGARGIKVCDRWRASLEDFLADMGPPPESGCDIDRIDNEGDYSPENCQWLDHKANTRKRRNTIWITINGKTACLKEWCEKAGLNYMNVYYLHKSGKPIEQLILVGLDRHITENKI